MSATDTIDVREFSTLEAPVPPRLRAIVARTSTNLFVACVVPALVVSVALVLVDVYAAIVAALAWTCAAICWRWATRRRPSGLLLLAFATLLVRTAFTLATGNTFVYFVQPVFANGGVAIVFMASLATATPVVARLAADFYPMEAGVSERPRVRRLFWQLTLLWGLVCLAKGLVTLWLLLSQSRADFVVAKNVAITAITGLTVAATIWLSAGVARKECLLAPRPRHPARQGGIGPGT
jgi:hypothetical protein